MTITVTQFVEANIRLVQGAASAKVAGERQELTLFANLSALIGIAWAKHSSVRPGSNKARLGFKLEDLAVAAFAALPAAAKTPEVAEGAERAPSEYRGLTFATVKQYMSVASTVVDTAGKRYNEAFSDAARRGDVPAIMKAIDAMGLHSIRGIRAIGSKKKGADNNRPGPVEKAGRLVTEAAKATNRKPETVLLAVAKLLKVEGSLKALIIKQANKAQA